MDINHIFHIYKNTNSHVVIYEWDNDKIKMYWVDSTDEKKERVKLTAMEKKLAYGIKIKGDDVKIAGAPHIKIKLENKKFIIELEGRDCYIRDVYIHIEGKNYLGVPLIKYAIVTGISIEGGEIVSDKITK